MDILLPPSTNFAIPGATSDFSGVSEIIDTFVRERLNQASKINKNWCSFYNKLHNVGWIIGHNSIFFFQYVSNQNAVNKSLIEFPKNQRIETPEHVKIFKKDKNLYAIIIYSNMIQVAKILTTDDEKDMVETLRFPQTGERIVAVSESWDEISSIYVTVLTNKRSLYLLQIEPRNIDLKIEFNISLHIINRKTKLLQKIKSYITSESDLQGGQVFCSMTRRSSDIARSSVKTYDIFSYANGKLEFFSLTLEQKNGKYFPSSHLYKWVINIRSTLEYQLSEKLYKNAKKLWDFEVIDLVPEIVKAKGQISLKLLARILFVNHDYLEGYFSYLTVTLDDQNGNIQEMEEYEMDDGFKIPLSDLQNREQVFYGRIISNLDNNEVYLCIHFSLRPKEGMIESGDFQQTQTNLFIELRADQANKLPLRGKILGAGNYFDYEHNEEDVLLVISDTELIKMKVLKHINESFPGSAQKQGITSSVGQNLRGRKLLRESSIEQMPDTSNLEEILSFSNANKIASQFREMLTSARDNLPSVKNDVASILRHNNPNDVWKGMQNFTNEILRTKNRNLVLVSTYVSKQGQRKEGQLETSDILLYEIKKKLKLMNAWIDFLKKFGLWNLDNPIRQLVYSNKEKLLAAVQLREEQILLNNQAPEDSLAAERKALLFETVLECIQKWEILANVDSDYYNNDIFYTKIEHFANFIPSLIKNHRKFVNSQHSHRHTSFICQVIVNIFNAFYEERDAGKYEALALWTQDENILDSLNSLLHSVIEGLKKSETEEKDLTSLGYILIREYNNILNIWPEETKWEDKMMIVYNALFNQKAFVEIGKYAEEFGHMSILSRLYYEYDYDHHIKELFVKWEHRGFLERFIDSYLQYLEKRHLDVKGPFKLFLNFEEFNHKITKYISERYPQLAWIFLIKNGEFFQGENVLRKVTPHESSLRNRLAEASTGRLCTSMASRDAAADYEKILRIDLVQDKSNIKPNLVHPEVLINTLLTDKAKNSSEKIYGCMKILANLSSNPYYEGLSTNDYRNMLASVILKAIDFDSVHLKDIRNSLDMGQPAEIINHKVSQTALWNNFDELLSLVYQEGTDVEKFMSQITNDESVLIAVQQMKTLKESNGPNFADIY